MSPNPDINPLPSRYKDAVVRAAENSVTLAVRVQPRSSRARVEGVKDGALRVRLTAPPAEGEANAQLIEMLSKELGVRKSAIRIVKGRTSREKLVEVEGLR